MSLKNFLVTLKKTKDCPEIRMNDHDVVSSSDQKSKKKKTENERKKTKNHEGQLFVCLQQALFKINKSVCHWYVLFDRNNTVHLGQERKYLKLKHKGPA